MIMEFDSEELIGCSRNITDSIPQEMTDNIVEKWEIELKEGKLSARHFRNYWKYFVPDLFSPQPHSDHLKTTYDEDQIQRILFDPLEKFMFGENPAAVSKSIRDLHHPPSFCGKIFKRGDPSYGCSDCAMDLTCVLCVECFQNSAHNKHRYKINTSSGGGYCDCGDNEAWKRDVFCHIHIKGEQSESENRSILSRLPSDLIERVQYVFDSVLQYSKELLTHDKNIELPSDLQVPSWEAFGSNDTYVTMLYNDETHTYDQVIKVLQKAIGCSKRDALSLATTIDKEGRCIVRCSTFQHCSQGKESMDKYPFRTNSSSKSLKVQVIHSSIIAHQVFASRLLQWLHSVLESAQAFRLIFTEIACRNKCELIENIFKADTLMWKTSRIQWQKILISGMLMEMESKKVFAKVFTKHYGGMMKAFMQDDHEHSVSVVSLAVQLFTVPTVAHMLIAEDGVLARLLVTFLSECQRNTSNGKLTLDAKSHKIAPFKRIQYLLYDFKYLLLCKPENWTNELRKGFLHGFENLIELLNLMQSMDSVVRQVGQHMEFEPEWESGIGLQTKLSGIIPLMIEWAASDEIVLKKAYRMILKKVGQRTTDRMRRKYVQELLDYSVSCIPYDVSSEPVSLHLPLTRLFAGLTLHLEKYHLTFSSLEFAVPGKLSLDELIEPVLCTLVMVSQVNAGMWRRNGYSLSHQIYFYHCVKCRQEMYDRDIVLLQEVASLMDANEFLIHVLNRYNLLHWAREEFETKPSKEKNEDNMHQITILAEEFLKLIMVLVAERFTPGIGAVTEEECLQKEIIQLLCIEPMPHSMLIKSVPEGVNRDPGFEAVISKVAVFKKSSPEAKGFFELKEDFYKEYNLFFYHYTREEQSKSEVAQRSRKKNAGEEICCPPPIPPPFTESFTLLLNILQCDVFLHIVRTVLLRIKDPKSQSVSELMVQIVLHMIGYALHEEERYIRNDNPYFRFTSKAEKFNILSILELLVGNSRTAIHKDMLNWTIRRFRGILKLYTASNAPQHGVNEVIENIEGPSRVACASSDKKRKAIAEKKARIMAKMANMQRNFIKKNEDFFNESSYDAPPADMPVDTPMEVEVAGSEVALGPRQSSQPLGESMHICILCHQMENLTGSFEDCKSFPVMVLGALVQKSSVLSKSRKTSQCLKYPEHHDTLVLPSDLHWGTYISSCGHAMHGHCWRRYFDDVCIKEKRKHHRGINLSFDVEKNEYLCPLCDGLCNCALPLLPNTRKKNTSKYTAKGNYLDLQTWVQCLQISLNSKKERVSATLTTEDSIEVVESCEDDLESSEKASGSNNKNPIDSTGLNKPSTYSASCIPPITLTEKIGTMYQFPTMDKLIPKLAEELNESQAIAFRNIFFHQATPEYPELALEMIGCFTISVYAHGLEIDPDHLNPRVIEMIWTSVAYTIHVMEETQRCQDRALLTSISTRLLECLAALVKFAANAPLTPHSKEMTENSTLRLLSSVLDIPCDKSMCILEWDAFSLLVSLSLGIPSMYPDLQGVSSGSIQEKYVLHLAFYSYLVQVLMSINIEILQPIRTTDNDDEPMESDQVPPASEKLNLDSKFLKDLLIRVRTLLKLPISTVDESILLEYVKRQCLPFLRCCALFFHFLTGVKAPEELFTKVWVPESEFLCILRYLDLGLHLQEVFNYPIFDEILERWCGHPRMSDCLSQWNSRFSNFSPFSRINQLVELPSDYSHLMNRVAQVPCPASICDDSRTPTMCLTCGDMLCSQSYCCQMELPENSQKMVGACTHHAHYCGAGTGVFLRVRECRVLLLSGRIKGCFFAPPYLDSYGETDQGIRRGNPLKLDKKLYNKLRMIWLSHSIPDIIARTMESTNYLLMNEWLHF